MDTIDKDHCCSICMDILKDPRQCANGHLFCLVCIVESMKFRKFCPICNCTIEFLSRNNEIERKLEEKIVRCCKIEPIPEYSCKWSGYEHDLELHSQVCPYREVKCTHMGCSAIIKWRYYHRHMAHCPHKTFNCIYCETTNLAISSYMYHMNQLCYYRSNCIQRRIPSPMYYNDDKEQHHTSSRLCNPNAAPTTLLKSTQSVKCVAWSADNLYLAYVNGNTVPVHNTVTGMLMNTISISSGPIDCIAWYPSSSDSIHKTHQIAVASGYIVCIVHALSSRVITMMISDKKINRISWNPNNSEGSCALVTSGNHHKFSVWDAETGQLIRSQSCEYQVKCIAWSPDGRYIASGCEQIRVWNADTGSLVNLFTSLDVYGPYCLDWSPCSTYLVSTSEGMNIALWETTHGTVVRILEGHSDNIVGLRWSPDGMYVASCSMDKTVRVWDTHSGACVSILKSHTEAVLSVAWSADSDYLLSGSADKQLLLW